MGAEANKLKKLKLTSVDMVRRGANQDAMITLCKNEDGHPGAAEDLNPGDIPQGLWKSIVAAVKSFMGAEEAREDDQEEDPEYAEPSETEEEDEIDHSVSFEKSFEFQDALSTSIGSILDDSTMTGAEKITMMHKSVDQFAAAYKELCKQFVGGAPPDEEETDDQVEEDPAPSQEYPVEEEEGGEEMKIDKSRFTPAELAQYNALIAKGVVEEEEPAYVPEEEEEMDLEKGCHPEVQKALTEMAALKKSMEMKELTEVAKRYEPLGKKADELAQTLYTMQKSSPASYNEYIAVLEQSLDLVNKSGMFTEIGKSARSIAGGSTVEKIEGIATELQKSDASLGRHAAIAKAWEQHPELVSEYDAEYRR